MNRSVHKGKQLSRRDDLESILYILICMVNGTLPWFNIDDEQEQLKIKEECWEQNKLSKGLPPSIQRLVLVITELSPDAEPPYDHMVQLML